MRLPLLPVSLFSRAGYLLPVRRCKRRPVDALVRRTLRFWQEVPTAESGTAPIGSASAPTRGRASARAKTNGTERTNQPVPGQGGVDSRPAPLKRETDRTGSVRSRMRRQLAPMGRIR